MKISKEHVNLVLILGVFVIILSTGYYFFYTLPKLNQEKLDFEKEKYRQEQLLLEEKKELEAQKNKEESDRKERELQIKENEYNNKIDLARRKENCKNSVSTYFNKICKEKGIDTTKDGYNCPLTPEEAQIIKGLQEAVKTCDNIQ